MYHSADIQLVSELGRRHLRSSVYRTLAVPRTRTTLGDGSFAVAGTRACVEQFTGHCKTDHQLRTVSAKSENTFIRDQKIAVHCDS